MKWLDPGLVADACTWLIYIDEQQPWEIPLETSKAIVHRVHETTRAKVARIVRREQIFLGGGAGKQGDAFRGIKRA